MKGLSRIITCVLLISVLVGSYCAFAQESWREKTKQQIEKKQKTKNVQSEEALPLVAKYKNKEYGFSIKYPKEYTKEKPKPKEIFRARSKNKLPFLTISIANIAEDTTFADLKEIYFKKLKANVKFLSDKKITLSDGITPAYESVVESKFGEYDLKILNLWVINRNRWLLVTATTVPKLWSQHEAEMRAIMQSFSAPSWKNVQEKMPVIPEELLLMEIQEKVAKSKVINPEGFKKLKHEFYSMIEEGLHPGAQLAVYYDGELVIHLAGGVKGPDGNKIMSSSELLEWHASEDKKLGYEPVTFDTLYQIRSTTKILTTLVMMMLHDQGRLDFDDLVAKHWPEFAKNGKENITIAQILSHRAGIPFLSHSLFVESPETPIARVEVGNRESIARAIEDTRPVWTPGKKNGYHGMAIGMVPDEIVARLTGKFPPMGDILRKEVFKPLGLKNIYLGLPASQYNRMAKMNVLDPQTTNRKGGSDFLNSKEGIQYEMSWVGCVSTAKDLADLMNIFVYEGKYKGKKFFSKEVQDRVSRPTNKVGEVDKILMKSFRWGLGFILGDTQDLYGTAPRPGVIGHVGGSATVAWADPKNKLAVAFLCNGMKNRKSMERYRRIGDGVYGALNLNPSLGMASLQKSPSLKAKYENEEYGFSINYPAEYAEEQPRPNEVFRARAKGKVPVLVISIRDIREGTTFTELKGVLKDRLAVAGIADVEFASEKKITLSDGVTPAHELEIEYNLRGYDFKTLYLWVVKQDKLFQVGATTTKNLWPKYKAEMKAIVHTFSAPTWKQAMQKEIKITADKDEDGSRLLKAKYENEEHGFSINYPAQYKVEPPKGWQDPTEVLRARSSKGVPILTLSINYMKDGTPYEEILHTFEDVLRITGITDVKAGKKKDILLADGTTAWQTEMTLEVRGHKLKSLNLWLQNPNNKDHFMWDKGKPLVATNKVYHDAAHPSALILPMAEGAPVRPKPKIKTEQEEKR